MNSPEVRPIPTKRHDYTRAIVWGIVLVIAAFELGYGIHVVSRMFR